MAVIDVHKPMGYNGETNANDISFSSGTTTFYGFLGSLINGESTKSWFIGMFKCRSSASQASALAVSVAAGAAASDKN